MRDQTDASGRLKRTALIFGGGRATRLGGVNKALLEVGGVRIIDRILEAVTPLADEIVLLTNDASLANIAPLRLVYDTEPHAGVLPALAAGLASATHGVCIGVACDMPFVSRQLLEYMLGLDADVVIPRTEGYLEPMHAIYRRDTVRDAIERALARGEQRMVSYLAHVHVREIGVDEWGTLDPMGRAFFNVNTPEDLAEAQRQASAQG